MKKIKRYLIVALTTVALVAGYVGAVISSPLAHAAQSTVGLGTTDPFAILAGTGVTNVPTSAITGNVGLHPGSGAAIAGLGCLEVTGTIYDRDGTFPGACEVTNDPLLNTAKNDLVTAYDDAAGRTPFTTIPNELGGTTQIPGVYRTATTFQITAGSGPLILDAQGDPNGVFIFQMESGATGLIPGPGSEVRLAGGAQACNVFWKLNTATIDTTAIFKGTILALTSITVANGADIEGRLLARNGNVTLISDTITRPATCTTASSGGSASGGSSSTPVPTLPNAGLVPESLNNLLWAVLIAIATTVVIALVSFRMIRNKRAS